MLMNKKLKKYYIVGNFGGCRFDIQYILNCENLIINFNNYV